MASTNKIKFRIKTDGDEVIISTTEKENSPILPFNVQCANNKAKLCVPNFKDFDTFFDAFYADIISMNITEKNVDKIFNSFEQLIENYDCLVKGLFPRHLQNESATFLDLAKSYVIDKIKARNTAKKRQKLIESDECYVKSKREAMGLTWKSKSGCAVDLIDHKLEQTTYQYVSIIDTLKSNFNNDQFDCSYFSFNENRKHICVEGIFEDFCCAKIYKENSVFTPTTIQIQLGIDDFDPLDALKSKAGLQKMCAVYMEIRNVDPKIKSKLSNVYLVALAKTQDIKSADCSNKIANKIVEELKILETTGIMTKSGKNLKAILVNVSSDNLGANSVFGFVECFVATYFCRICELTSTECKVAVEEVVDKLRRKVDYVAALEMLKDNENPNFKETKGIKKNCAFNNLQHFHILENCCVDVMHDVNEGVIPFFIKFLFETIIEKKVANLAELQSLCRDYNYGWFWKKYKPSTIKLERNNLSLNAMQSYCLMLHLPFILIKLRTKLGNTWTAMEHLLQILQILYSTQIRESDVNRLRDLLKLHLSYLVEMGAKLIPKHHMTTHYPNLISRIGPLIHSWMMRFESKHKMLTDIVHLTNNFKNLPLTIAKRHQERVCINKNMAFNIKMEISKRTYDISKRSDYEVYKSKLLALNSDASRIKGIHFIQNGPLEFRAGLMLIEGDSILQIVHVITDSSKYFLLYEEYNVVQFVFHLNSIEIEKNNRTDYKLVDISDIKTRKSYDCTYLADKTYIIVDTLDVYDNFQ